MVSVNWMSEASLKVLRILHILQHSDHFGIYLWGNKRARGATRPTPQEVPLNININTYTFRSTYNVHLLKVPEQMTTLAQCLRYRGINSQTYVYCPGYGWMAMLHAGDEIHPLCPSYVFTAREPAGMLHLKNIFIKHDCMNNASSFDTGCGVVNNSEGPTRFRT